jgi:PKD repeat protein
MKYVNVTSKPAQLVLPVANFRSNITSGYTPLNVKFTDLSKNITSWSWNFGDGSSNSFVVNPEHVFKTKGLFKVVLTASNANGTSSKSMTINVTSNVTFGGSNNNNLTSLIINSGGTLTPAFSPGTTNYTYNMFTVTPTAEDSNANITVNGTPVASGKALPISLNMGQNIVNIAVTAQNGTTKTYTVMVNR